MSGAEEEKLFGGKRTKGGQRRQESEDGEEGEREKARGPAIYELRG